MQISSRQRGTRQPPYPYRRDTHGLAHIVAARRHMSGDPCTSNLVVFQGCQSAPPPPPPPGRPAYAQPLSPCRQVPASTAFVTDSNRPRCWQPPPTACLTASGATSEAPFLPTHCCPGGNTHTPHTHSCMVSLCYSVHRQVVSHLSTERVKLGLISETGRHHGTTSR